jgi:glutathionylspermidine synthase
LVDAANEDSLKPFVAALSNEPLARNDICRALGEEFYVWDAFVAGDARVLLNPLVLDEDTHALARRAAEAVGAATYAVAERAVVDAELRRGFRLHPDTEALAEASCLGCDDEGLARVDLLWARHGDFVACEINADCPGGHNETEALPRLLRRSGARAHDSDLVHELGGLTDPTDVVPDLVARMLAMSGGTGSPNGAIALTYATAYAEDLQICAYLERALERAGARVLRVPITALRAGQDGRIMARGAPISVLYRYFPTEYLAGARNLTHLLRAVADGKLKTISSFSHIYAQSKHALSLLDAVPQPVRARATPHIAETFAFQEVPVRDLFRNRGDWVVKRALGRVGDEVFVGSLHSKEEWSHILHDVEELVTRKREAWIAQRFVDQGFVSTPWGPRLVTLGAYLRNGVFKGYFARLSDVSHVSHESVVVPVLVQARARVAA